MEEFSVRDKPTRDELMPDKTMRDGQVGDRPVLRNVRLVSPDGYLVVTFGLTGTGNEEGIPTYSVRYKDRPVLLESCLGLELDGVPSFRSGFAIADVTTSSRDEEWVPVYGERDRIRDRYNALHITLREMNSPGRTLVLTFRAYNEGVAFRYEIPEQAALGRFVIAAERTQFRFPEGCYAWEEHGSEGEYYRVRVEDLKPLCERPLTVEYPDGLYVCLTEAGLNDYARMLLGADRSRPGTVVSMLSGLITEFVGYGHMAEDLPEAERWEKMTAEPPFATPWRVLIVGERPGDLLERNDLVLNLNEPCALVDTSWIVPGKAIRDMTLSTPGSKACIDLAARFGFKYLILDWGWYGDPFDDRSDAAKVANPVWFFDPVHQINHPGLDLHELIAYGKEKGVGIVLYLDRRVVERQIDRLLPIYREWGIQGIKIGFVNTGPQRWTKWLVDVVRKCAEYRMVVIVHDAYRPTGLSRTYPNLLTQEGIRGNEHMPTARHNATLPFTRFPAGAGDYTICYYTERKQTTFAHQLAMSVVVYSPFQPIFWYDRPGDLQGEPELEFFAKVPTVWNDTRVLAGEIGEFVVIARRSGDEWFVGCITNEQGRELAIRLDFLEPGIPYIARVYADDPDNDASRTKVAVTVKEVNAASVLRVTMAPSGGQAIHLAPKRP